MSKNTAAKTQDVGTNEGTLTSQEYYEERVPMTLIKDNDRYKDDVTVTLNGYNYTILRGVSVMVPRKVAMVIEDAFAQQMEAEDYISSLTK